MFNGKDSQVDESADRGEPLSECGRVPDSPLPEEVAIRAHSYWQQRLRSGASDGSADDDWFRAERELDLEKF
jgi:hypothetical protein